MGSGRRWVVDTSVYTHLWRAGHACILEQLAPGGVILLPLAVDDEVQEGRVRHRGIPDTADVAWAELSVLNDDEYWHMLTLKAAMGGTDKEHLGECAVIACAAARGHVAILDERVARAMAKESSTREDPSALSLVARIQSHPA